METQATASGDVPGAPPEGIQMRPLRALTLAPPELRYLPTLHAQIPGNRCALLRDGVEAYPSMLEAIHQARRYVRLETYMFFDDAVGEAFRDALVGAAARGVEVTVLYDALGSWTTPETFFEKMRKGGVDVRGFRPLSARIWGLWHRDHRKILVVDGEVAFTGGINVAVHWAPKGVGAGRGWRDDVLRIEGPAVRELERRFRATWRFSFRRRLRTIAALMRRSVPQVRGDVTLSVLSSRRSIHRAYLHAIRAAERSVLVAAAYFVPDRSLVRALRQAAARGVEVALILNRNSDHAVLQLATQRYYDRLLAAGIRIFEWHQGVLHAKTAVVDGVWGTLGSFNLERTSLHLNHETNVVFADLRLGKAVEDSFRNDCGFCHEVELATWSQRPTWRKLLERLCYLFRKAL